MKNEYLKYTTEKLTLDSDFIAWVNLGRNQERWEEFLEANPEINKNVESARKIVELLRDRQDHIDPKDASEIWKSIEKFDLEFRRHSRTFKIRRIFRYAAIFIAFLMIGGVGAYWYLSRDNQFYTFSTKAITRSDNQSRLLLSDGTKVNLDKKNSKISIASEQQIVINNNKVIDLTEADIADQSKMNEIVIPFGKKSQLILEDGTKVWLNAGTRMAFPTKFSGKKREVFLDGEAYFEVTHNKDIPFVVNTNEIAVKDLGTRFNISAYSTDQFSEAILLEGKVSVSGQSALKFMQDETILAPNQKASFNKEMKTILVSNEPDAEMAIAWTEGWFKFSQQNLNGVLNKLQRYYNIKFVFENNFTTDDLITGKLDLKESIEQVMMALGDVANIQYRITGDQIFINKKLNELKLIK